MQYHTPPVVTSVRRWVEPDDLRILLSSQIPCEVRTIPRSEPLPTSSRHLYFAPLDEDLRAVH